MMIPVGYSQLSILNFQLNWCIYLFYLSLIHICKEMLAHSDDFPVQPVTQVFRAPTDNDKSFGNWLAKDWKYADG